MSERSLRRMLAAASGLLVLLLLALLWLVCVFFCPWHTEGGHTEAAVHSVGRTSQRQFATAFHRGPVAAARRIC